MVEKSSNKRKRKFKRVDIELEVKYQSIQYQDWYTTVTLGIGTGGICLISMEYLGIGSIINIQLLLPGSISLIEVSGEVLWSNFLIDRKLYESGIKFSGINNNDKELISRYIDDFVRFKKGI